MNAKQENHLRMYYGVKQYADGPIGIIDKIPFFEMAYVPFVEAYEGILEFRVVQEGDKTGVSMDKKALRKQLEAVCLQLSVQLQAIAGVTKSQSLAKEAKYTASDLVRARTLRIKGIAELLHGLATEHLSDLAVYEVTTASLADFMALILKYGSSISQPRLTIDQKANATSRIKELMAVAEEKLGLLDTLVEAVKGKFPAFHDGYVRARKVVNLGSGGLALRVNAEDAGGQPLANVTFKILSHHSEGHLIDREGALLRPLLIKRTAKKGGFYVRNMAEGRYKALVGKLGYQEQELDFYVLGGELADLKVKLEAG